MTGLRIGHVTHSQHSVLRAPSAPSFQPWLRISVADPHLVGPVDRGLVADLYVYAKLGKAHRA
ncbi:hypothetical protein [Paracoccus benzoatiresistens]|uniref:Uncharacterized protein n=1 Tax=Paracoccus benzoatiresistens TaxID=2997341 RepID=A0ABT4JBB8_9RHOB|nr:hypothetical protein [Paracoccus sp. EF6]MCZ0964382.1 hypothetical protein [Paracoccus sp. EF6]